MPWRQEAMKDGKTQSAYCKPGGEKPLCFDEDITEEMLQHYRNWRVELTPMEHIPRKKDACG